ncbi:MAG: DNA cytosine methyltransferase [Desulfurococcales archaeon]|nr:DNA cytosine methyltransferase [Desulfurococcales archaeon]
MRKKYSVLDVFSGAGGFSRGFQDEGYDIVLGIDNFPPAAKTFKLNFPPSEVLAEDVKNVSAAVIRDFVGMDRGDFDVVIASPPCEPFTGANPGRERDPLDRLYRDPRGVLFLHAIRLIGELKPRVFVIENVPGILEPPLRSSIRKELSKVGYESVFFNVLRAEDYLVPSSRTRVFVSNIRITPKPLGRVNVSRALEGLPPPGSLEVPNHEEPSPLPRRHQKRVSRLRWGDSLITYRGAEGRRLPNYIRVDPRKPAPTIMGTSRLIHPFEDRLLTVREQARLMGFPDHHVFLGSKDAQYDMVGEAVPPPLARAIALDILPRLGEEP